MDNWLTETLGESGMTPSEAAAIIKAPDNEFALYMEHPGMLTINEVGMLARRMPPEHARRMLDRIVEVFAL
ncbi:hypothetical protein QUW41_07240 [Slackia piriformis]|nr:hypothetical protein [Slackia piriformis]